MIIEEEQKPDIEDNDINNTEDETNNNITKCYRGDCFYTIFT